MNKLSQKIALVTGGGTGIGRAIALELAKNGAQVVIVGRSEKTLRESAARHADIHYMIADIMKTEDIASTLSEIKQRFGKLDILVNNAGVAPLTPIEQVNLADYDNTFNLNVRALIDISAQSIPFLRESKGNIVNITSGLVNNPMPMNSIYTASKAAVLSLTRTWAKELASHRIRVNSVASGAVKTPLYDKLGLSAQAATDYENTVTQVVPLGRFGEAEEIAAIVAFIASNDASYVTGAHYAADGGFGI